MTDPMEVVEKLCDRYQTAVSNNDSGAYRELFAEDAIRIPPGSDSHPEIVTRIVTRPSSFNGTEGITDWMEGRLLSRFAADGPL